MPAAVSNRADPPPAYLQPIEIPSSRPPWVPEMATTDFPAGQASVKVGVFVGTPTLGDVITAPGAVQVTPSVSMIVAWPPLLNVTSPAWPCRPVNTEPPGQLSVVP